MNTNSVPTANVIVMNGGSSTANDTDGIRTNGSLGISNIITFELTNRLQGTGTTVGAVTADVITFALGSTASAFSFEFLIAGFESTTPAGLGYKLIGAARTTGAAATILDTPDLTKNPDVALLTANADLIASGNNIILRVQGIGGATIQWSVVGNYVFVS